MSADFLSKLRGELERFKERHPALSDDNLFVLWFMRAYVGEDETKAAEALSGQSEDLGIDAIFVDDRAKVVFLIQGKYRARLGSKNEKREDIRSFASLASILSDAKEQRFNDYIKTAHAMRDRLRECRRRILKDKYRLALYYVTLGKCSESNQKDAKVLCRQAKCDATIDLIDAKRLPHIFHDYEYDVAPPIPLLDLEMESGAGVQVNGVMQRFDRRAKTECWVFSMQGSAVANLFEIAGVRLFARNIRLFLGRDTPVNREISKTLEKEPGRFFYYNNGITIVCDKAERRSREGRDFLQVSNPQVINGQQTTRTLFEEGTQSRQASVLVKVIQVPRAATPDGELFEELVSRIVAGTNWQNAINAADLVSNDKRQIDLEREFRHQGFLYLRKRQGKTEIVRKGVVRSSQVIKNSEAALAVAACELDPRVARSGKDHLFAAPLYDQVFPNADPMFYLPRIMLMRQVSSLSRKKSERSYAKWMVAGYVWGVLAEALQGRRYRIAFSKELQGGDGPLTSSVDDLIELAFKTEKLFYAAKKNEGSKVLDVSQFYRNQLGRGEQFETFAKSTKNKYRKRIEAAARNAREVIRQLLAQEAQDDRIRVFG